MTARALAVVLASGCGRIGFDAVGGSGDPTMSQLTLSAPAAPLAEFPLLVILDDLRAARDRMQPDASDLRFFDAAGNVLPHEIEQLGSPEGPPLVAWVRVPLIDGPTTLEIGYGDATPVAPSTRSVWSDSYAAVYHLAELDDATPHDLTGTWVGGPRSVVDGWIAKTHAFRATTSDAIVIADASAFSFGTAFTVAGWIKPLTLAAGSGYSAIVSRENGNSSDEDFWLGVEDVGRRGHSWLGTQPGVFGQGGAAGSVTLGTWSHVAMTYNGTMARLYVDGTQVLVTPVTGAMTHAPNPIVIGADCNAGEGPDADFIDGSVDEVRLETVTRPAEWIAYDVASMRDQVITYGPITRP